MEFFYFINKPHKPVLSTDLFLYSPIIVWTLNFNVKSKSKMFYWAKKNVKIGHFHLEIANETEDQKSKDIEINQINKK